MKIPPLKAIYAAEILYERSLDLTTVRGPQVCGNIVPGDRLVVDSLGLELTIQGEGFRPGRVGLEGKMLSHRLREGLWSVQGAVPQEATRCFLVSPEQGVTRRTLELSCVENLMASAEGRVDLRGEPVPVSLGPLDLVGVLRLSSASSGLLELLAPEGFTPPAQLELRLGNTSIWSGLAFLATVAGDSGS